MAGCFEKGNELKTAKETCVAVKGLDGANSIVMQYVIPCCRIFKLHFYKTQINFCFYVSDIFVNFTTVRSLIKLNTTVTSRLQAGTA
jgi:hypothetical protein